jgi:hypothetical protein
MTPRKSVRTGWRISKDMYWCVQYLTTVVRENQSDLLLGALKLGIEMVRNNSSLKKEPKVATKQGRRVDIRVPKEIFVDMTMLKLDKELYTWDMADFLRVGLKASLLSYSYRYPEIERITRRFEGEGDENQDNSITEL